MLHLSSSTLAASNDHSMHHSLTQCHKPLDYATSSRAPMCRRPWLLGGGEAESKVGSKGGEPFFRFANLRLQMGGKVPRTQKNIKDAKSSETPHTTSPHHLPTRTPPLAPPLFTASTPPPCVRPGWYAARSNPNRAGQDAEGLVGTIRKAS